MTDKLLANIVLALIDAGLDGPDGVGHSDAHAVIRAINASGEWKVVPTRLTAENGMKAALMGEFHETVTQTDGDLREYTMRVPVSWTSIKEIHRAMIASAPTPEDYPPDGAT